MPVSTEISKLGMQQVCLTPCDQAEQLAQKPAPTPDEAVSSELSREVCCLSG